MWSELFWKGCVLAYGWACRTLYWFRRGLLLTHKAPLLRVNNVDLTDAYNLSRHWSYPQFGTPLRIFTMVVLLRRLRSKTTPLKIRATIRRTRHAQLSRTALRCLVWPSPWFFSLPTPLSVNEIQHDPSILNDRQRGIDQLYEIPLFRARDTPLRALYRIYENLCAGRLILMSYDYNYFYSHDSPRWRLSSMPDPQDNDAVRYAILASLVEAMAEAMYFRLQLGIPRTRQAARRKEGTPIARKDWETPPSWAERVPAIADGSVDLVPSEEASKRFEALLVLDKNFLKRNVRATLGYLYTV